jgi:hypothetical protein
MAITFVQQANSGTPAGGSSIISLPATFPSAQSAGSLNVVGITYGFSGANPATEIVTECIDTMGNAYSAATAYAQLVGAGGDADGVQIYYAPNIVSAGAGANTVTVSLNSTASFFMIWIGEYSGIVLSTPIDVTASNVASSPSSTSMTTTAATTTNSLDLIFGLFCAFDGPSATGAGYTNRLTQYTMLVEDKTVSSPGSYSATGNSSGTGGYVGQMVAFKGLSGGAQIGSVTIATKKTLSATSRLVRGGRDTVAGGSTLVLGSKVIHKGTVTI